MTYQTRWRGLFHTPICWSIVACLAGDFDAAAQVVERSVVLDLTQQPVVVDGSEVPPGWQLERLAGDGTTRHDVRTVDGMTALCIESSDDATALVHTVEIDPTEFPRIRFWLRVGKAVEGGDLSRKEGDDFAARVFVNFAFDSNSEGWFSRLSHSVAERTRGRTLPGHALNYVWGNAAEAGLEARSAYTDRVQMVVVDGGSPGRPQWRQFERNVVEDYARAFDKPAPAVLGIGIMSDSDDTGGTATACFGPVEFLGSSS